MFDGITGGRPFGQYLVLAGITAGATLVGVSAAAAGSCPSDKMKADVRPPVTDAAKGVTDTVLAAIDLEKEPANIKGRQLGSANLLSSQAASCLGTVTAIVLRSSTSQKARSSNMPATARFRLCTKLARSGRRRVAPPIGGRTWETRPSFCLWATFYTTKAITTCDARFGVV